MADLADDPTATFLPVRNPASRRYPSGVDPGHHHQPGASPRESVAHAAGKGRKPAIEPDHQPGTGSANGFCEGFQLLLIHRRGFLEEYVASCGQSPDCKRRVRVVPCSDHHRVDVRATQDVVERSGNTVRAKLVRCVPRAEPAARGRANEAYPGHLLERREQHAGSKGARSDCCHSQRARDPLARRSGRRRKAALGRLRLVCQKHAQVRLCPLSGNERVSVERLLEREPVREQALHVQASRTNCAQHRLQIPSLSPSHVPDGIVLAALLVVAVVASGAVAAGYDDLDLLLEVGLAWELHRQRSDDADTRPVTRQLAGKSERLAGGRRGCHEHGVRPIPARRGTHYLDGVVHPAHRASYRATGERSVHLAAIDVDPDHIAPLCREQLDGDLPDEPEPDHDDQAA